MAPGGKSGCEDEGAVSGYGSEAARSTVRRGMSELAPLKLVS